MARYETPVLREKHSDHIWSWQMTSESDTTVGKLELGEKRAGVGEASREGFSSPGTQGP